MVLVHIFVQMYMYMWRMEEYMAVASGLAGPVLAGPVLTLRPRMRRATLMGRLRESCCVGVSCGVTHDSATYNASTHLRVILV